MGKDKPRWWEANVKQMDDMIMKEQTQSPSPAHSHTLAIPPGDTAKSMKIGRPPAVGTQSAKETEMVDSSEQPCDEGSNFTALLVRKAEYAQNDSVDAYHLESCFESMESMFDPNLDSDFAVASHEVNRRKSCGALETNWGDFTPVAGKKSKSQKKEEEDAI